MGRRAVCASLRDCAAQPARGKAGLRAPTIRRLLGGGRTEEQPRSALRLFFASRFARLRGIACWGWGRVAGSNHSPPVRRREDRGTASLSAPAVFCIVLCAIARHSRAGKKKRQPSRATAAGRHAPFPVSYTIRLPAGSICARNIIPWFCPLRKYKKQG